MNAVWVCMVRGRAYPGDRLFVICRSSVFDDGMRPGHKEAGCGVYVKAENEGAVVGPKPTEQGGR